MILIQSSKKDLSTSDVLDWFFFLSQETDSDVLRINDFASIDEISIFISTTRQEIVLSNDGSELNINEITHRWYRRGQFVFSFPLFLANTREEFLLAKQTREYLNAENEQLYSYIDSVLRGKTKSLNSFNASDTNKLNNLTIAQKVGLVIPDTLITNEIDRLLDFVTEHTHVITKTLFRNTYNTNFEDKIGARIGYGTVLQNKSDIEELKVKHLGKRLPLPSFYQKYIEKKYEIRIFYLMGIFYPMAIFSQTDEKTRVDVRNYDLEHPNRCVPYKLPIDIENKLHRFMQNIDLNCGSIDIILTPQDEYVFLEVNPVGQFQWLSRNCNYDIERKIALYLMNEKL